MADHPSWLAHLPWGLITTVGLVGAAAVLVTAVLVVVARDQLAAWRHTRWARDARWVTVAAPPQVEAGSLLRQSL